MAAVYIIGQQSRYCRQETSIDMISRKCFKYSFENLKTTPWKRETFSIVFNAVPEKLSGIIAESEYGFSIYVKHADVSDYDAAKARGCNYFFEKNNCRILEVSGVFAGESEPYVIGFPLYLAGNPGVVHEFAVTYDGVWFSIFCDGILYDRDSPDGGALASDAVPAVIADVDMVISGSIDGVAKQEKTEHTDIPFYCYTPAGFNTWAGDVTLSSFCGVFHLFYLHDRHHHTSRKGRGAHLFCHLTSRNLIDWTDHGEVIGFDKPYLTVGTGNSFVLDNRLYIAFGWHTERSKPHEQCAAALLKSQFEKTARVDSVSYSELGEIYPSGASYAVSSDGIEFDYSNKIIHYVENPNITVIEDGSLRLCEYGIWTGKSLDSWRLVDSGFPPRLRNSLCLNTTECPCFFTLENREYLMIGFTGFYRREPDGSLKDLAAENLDFYDGMAVPMAVKHDGRVIAGAWMNTPEWGSFLMLRELIALENGGIGSRWIPETLPAGDFVLVENGQVFDIPEKQINTKLLFRANERLKIKFSGKGTEFYLVIDRNAHSAAWLNFPDAEIEYLRDIVKRRSDAESFRDLSGEPIHVWGENYARKIELPDAEFDVRLIIHNEAKFHGAVVDVEISGRYTFATYRRNLKQIDSVFCKG